MANVVLCGYMTKSPPENKFRNRIFRSQWKKRYFVLRKPTGSLPDQYELIYYKDERCTSKKGSINLDQCQQIIEALDSEVFPHLLAIKTTYKHKIRMYYLATETEYDMNSWVQSLCHVCGLRPEDQPTDIPEPKPDIPEPKPDIPEPKPDIPARATTQLTGSPGITTANSNGASTIAQSHSMSSSRSPLPNSKNVQPSRTTPSALVSTNSSPFNRPQVDVRPHFQQTASEHNSTNSSFDLEAPPIPEKRHAVQARSQVSVPSLYDHPPPQRSIDKTSNRNSSSPCKPTLVSQGNTFSLDVTDQSSRVSYFPCIEPVVYPVPSNDNQNCIQAHTSLSTLDTEEPPLRPPKPDHLVFPYQNLPQIENASLATSLMTSIPAPSKSSSQLIPGYDIPRQVTRKSSPQHHPIELAHVPKAPTKGNQQTVSHNYLNTNSQVGLYDVPPAEHGQSSVFAETLAVQPDIPLPRRSGFVGDTCIDHSHKSVYQHPPSSSHMSSGSPAFPRASPAHRSTDVTHNGSPPQDDNKTSTNIYSTKRTRSFKSPHSLQSGPIRQSPKSHGVSLTVTIPAPKPLTVNVPAPRPLLPPRPPEISNSDDEQLLAAHDHEEETHHPLSLLRSIPAPPAAEPEWGLKYIDLALPESNQEFTRSSHPHGHTHHSHGHAHSHPDRNVATEYREIDFVKTQALSDTKRVKDKERKHDVHI